MASRATIQIDQMKVPEEGYCAVDAVYAAPCSPHRPEEGRDVGATSLYLLPDADVHAEASPIARIRVRRLDDGFAIRVPTGEVPSRYRGRPVEGSLPVTLVE